MQPSHDDVRADTQRWLERAVIGLNLCPFAKSVHVKRQVHYVVSDARGVDELSADLEAELQALLAVDATERDTTLLIAPYCLHDFLDFNDFLDQADATLRRLRLDGVLQIASLHPAYQFAGTDAERNSEQWKAWRQSPKWNAWAAAIAPSVAGRRRCLQLLGDKQAVSTLFSEVAGRFADRPGGYTRIVRLAKVRLGDAGEQAILEFVGVRDRVVQKSQKPAFDDAPAAK